MNEHTQEHASVAIYESHSQAESAVRALQEAGLDMKGLSIVGKDFHTEEHALGFHTSGERMNFWAGRGAVWGSLRGMLFGSALSFIPAIGPVVSMGPLVGWIVGAFEDAPVAGAAGVLSAALTSIGIPKDSGVEYELEVKAGKFLIIARGPADMIEHACGVLGTTGAAQLTAHAA
jgi:hypothetical protein